MLSLRLNKILNLINKSDLIVDVGTDHALLPIQIILNNKSKYVYATDINLRPLQSALKNIEKYNLKKEIKLIHSNGLNFLYEVNIDKKIDYLIISGLGTTTILDILKRDNNIIDKYLICSNTDIKKIREWALNKNFYIEYEEFFNENNHNYWLIIIDKNNNKKNNYDKLNIQYGPYSFLKNELYVSFLKNEIMHKNKILKNISSNNIRHNEFKNEISNIKEYLEWQN